MFVQTKTFKRDNEHAIQKKLYEIYNSFGKLSQEEISEVRLGIQNIDEHFSMELLAHQATILINKINDLVNLDIQDFVIEDKRDENFNIKEQLEILFREIDKNSPLLRISKADELELELQLDDISKLTLVNIIIDSIQEFSVKLDDTKYIEVVSIYLVILAKLCYDINKLDYFYGLILTFIDGLSQASEFQFSRDLGEEILIKSLKENKLEYALVIYFRIYQAQNNTNLALLFANAFLEVVIPKGSINTMLLKKYLFTLHRIFRNLYMEYFENAIYVFIIKHIKLNQYEKDSITHSHFGMKILIMDNTVIMDILNFLNENREEILKSGEFACKSWLSTIYSLQKLFADNVDIEILSDYVQLFERVIASDTNQKLKAYTVGKGSEIKEIFIKELLKLNKTRSKDDFIHEVKNCMVLANKLLEFSIEQNDIEGFLLSQILKNDKTLLFDEKYVDTPDRVIKIEFDNKNDDLSAYLESFLENVKKNFSFGEEYVCIWLSVLGDNVFYLSLTENNFDSIKKITNWRLQIMNDSLKEDFSEMKFNDTIKIKGFNVQYDEYLQLSDYNTILQKYSYSRINDLKINNKRVLVVKDMLLSRYPLNLLIDDSGDFVSRNSSITNILSTEWFIRNSNLNCKKINLSNITAWIPTEGGDLAINYINDKLSNFIKEKDILLINARVPPTKLIGEINIIVAHGAKDIATLPFLKIDNETYLTDILGIMGEGVVAVLFVCFAGSAKKDSFSERIQTVAKSLMDIGYKAVIAPVWALNISVPHIWLPEFYNQLYNGVEISEALFLANRKIFNINKNPGAWACMHLYGNPHLTLK